MKFLKTLFRTDITRHWHSEIVYHVFALLIWILGFSLGVEATTNYKMAVKHHNIDYEKKQLEIQNTSFWDIASNNLIVYTLLFLGFFTLSISTVVILLYNSLIIGHFYCFSLLTISYTKALLLTFTHFLEYVSLIYASGVSLKLSFYCFDKNKLIDIEKISADEILRYYIPGVLLVFLAAFIEKYITTYFL